MGGALGGPVGLVMGAKLGAAAALGGGIVGEYTSRRASEAYDGGQTIVAAVIELF